MPLFMVLSNRSAVLGYVLKRLKKLVFPWLLQQAPRATPWVMMALGIFLYPFAWPSTFNIANIVMYLPFFSAGILLGQHWRKAASVINPRLALWAVPFLAALVYCVWQEPLPKWFVGTLSVPFVLALANQMQGPSKSFFMTAGIGVAKAVTLSVIPWRDGYFEIAQKISPPVAAYL
ncbi:hypothetical protein [Aquabacterium sp.]|uniref:hypothetical protein n=1 Tax=Aquabacterium sp. TaxID=1872578 RepID=UPI0019967C9D|nr:hypothetical protein [Aquabacterium sp.]MBC7701969.1 hypothetical protein [Aquabacterium sp.]